MGKNEKRNYAFNKQIIEYYMFSKYPSEQVRMDYSSSYRVVKAISLPSALA